MENKKKLIIADITSLKKGKQSFGHFFNVAEMYSKIFENEYDVYISGGPVYKDKFDKLIPLKYDVDLSEFNNVISKIKTKIKELINARCILKENRDSIIIFQDYSNLSLFLSIYLFNSSNKIYLIQYKNEVKGGFQKIIFNKIKHKVNGIICPKESVGKEYGVPYIVVPDYIYIEGDTNKKYDDVIEYDYGVFGIIRQGKDVVGVANLFRESNHKLVIAGSVQDEMMLKELSYISSKSSNITFINEYLSKEKYSSLISKTKCVILPYVDDYYNESSSGVVFDILFRGKPVLTKKYSIFEFINKYEVGYLYDRLDNIDLNKFISDKKYNKYKENINKYLSNNKNYIDILVRFINK